MKKIILVLLCFISFFSFSQTPSFKGISINGAEFFVIDKNATLAVDGDIWLQGSTTSDVIKHAGTIRCSGDLINDASATQFFNQDASGKVELYGDSIQYIKGNLIRFPNLEIAKTQNELVLNQSISVDSILKMSGGDLHLNGFNIDLLNTYSKVQTETNDKRIYGTVGGVKGDFSSATSTDILGLGLTISGNQGLYKIERNHAFAPGTSTNGSILRSYKITSKTKITNPETWTVTMSYFDTKELRSLNEAKFSLFSSTNEGKVWKLNESVPYVALNQVVCSKFEVSTADTVIYLTLAETVCVQVPTVSLGADTQYVCKGDTLILDAKNVGFTHIWTSNVWAPSKEVIAQKIKVTDDGVFYVKVRDANGCVGLDSVHVYQKPYPVAGFTVKPVCQNDSSVFVNTSTLASGTKTYKWDFGDTQLLSDTSILENPSYKYDTSGIYVVKLSVTSEYNCTHSFQNNLLVRPLPIADFSFVKQCVANTNVFTNTSAIQSQIGANQFSITKYHWDFGTTSDTSNSKNPSFVFPKEGLYTVQLQAISNGTCRDTVTKVVEVFPRATVDFSVSNVCLGNDISIVNNTAIQNASYLWSFSDGLFSSEKNPSKIYTNAGDYSVKLKVTTENLCTDSLEKPVTVYALPQAEFSLRDTCETNDVSLSNLSRISTSDQLSYQWKFGDNTTSTQVNPIKNFSIAKDYNVELIVTSDKSCKDTVTKPVTIHPNPIVNFDFIEVCEGNDVTFRNFSSISSGTIAYNWDFGNGQKSSFKNPVETFDKANTYIVTLKATSSKACVASLSKNLEIFPLPIIDIPSKVSTCAKTIVLDAGNVGSTYLWSDNSTSSTNTITQSGTYSVRVTSPKSCATTNQFEVALESSFTPNFPASLTACDLAILDAGNPGSISYTWSTGETTRLISVNQSGTYSLEVVDQNNCAGQASVDVTINKSPIVNLGPKVSICSKDSYTLTAPSFSGTYLWSTGEKTQSITVTEANVYQVKLTTPENCTGTSSVEIGLYALPTFSLGQDRSMCDSITLISPLTAIEYTWSDGSKGKSFWTDKAGLYWLEIKDAHSCTFRDSLSLNVSPKPIVNLGEDQTICDGKQVLLDAQNSGSKFSWQDGSTESTLLVSSTGTFKVKVTNEFNCWKEDEIKITVAPKVQVNLGEDKVLCAGQALDLDAGYDGSTYEWETASGVYSTEKIVSIQDSGVYWVKVTTVNGCNGIDSISVRVSKDTISVDYLAVSTADVGDTIQFISLALPEGVGYNWYFDDGISSTAEDPQHIFQEAKSYQVTLTVSNQYCSKTIAKEILIRDLKKEEEEDPIFVSYNEIESAITYPNPTSGPFTLEVQLKKEGLITVLVYDLEGRKIDMFSETTEFLKQELDWREKSANMYLLKVVVGNKTKLLKVLKY